MPSKNCSICHSKTTLGNGHGTIAEEVLQSRCSTFFGKKVYAGVKFIEQKRRLGQLIRIFRPLAIPAPGTYPHTTDVAVNTKRSLVERTVNNKRVQTSRKNPCTSATTALPDMSVGNHLRQRVQRFAFHVQHIQTCSYSKVCLFQLVSSVVFLI